jgi:hypothetical protein
MALALVCVPSVPKRVPQAALDRCRFTKSTTPNTRAEQANSIMSGEHSFMANAAPAAPPALAAQPSNGGPVS